MAGFESLVAEQEPNALETGLGAFEYLAAKSKPKEESYGRSALRYAAQVPLGIAQMTIPGMASNIMQLIGTGTALDPEEIDQIRRISEQEGIPFDEEAYRESVAKASEMFPTPSNIARMVEEETDLPLTPQTRGQKLFQLAASAGKAAPGNLGSKAIAAATAPAVSAGTEALGVPEPIADILGLGVGVPIGASTQVSKATKPSGMIERRFEKLKEPRTVSEGRKGKITEKLEKDFKKISNHITASSPIEKTKATLAENPAFKSEVAQRFKEVEALAESLPERLNTEVVKKKLVDNITKKKGTGFAPSEYDVDYRKFIKNAIQGTPKQEIGAAELVAQYRKNNKALSEAFDPGRSKAYNRAKVDATLDYNRAIADTIEETFPKSELSNLFQETNKQWSQIADVEAMDKFFEKVFTGDKIDFAKARKFFDSPNQARPFKKALGEQYPKFEQLMKDMLTTEKPYKMLQVAKEKGFSDLVKTAAPYIIHPKLGVATTGLKVAKGVYKYLGDALLDKPKLTITWSNALKSLGKGDFKAAEREFSTLHGEVLEAEGKSANEALKKPEIVEVKTVPMKSSKKDIFEKKKSEHLEKLKEKPNTNR